MNHLTGSILCLLALQQPVLDSGTPETPEQACYDVLHYGLTLKVDPEKHTIAGTLRLRARVVAKSNSILLDLDERLAVASVTRGKETLGA